MGKIQVRRIFGNADESRFGRCEAVTKPFLGLQALIKCFNFVNILIRKYFAQFLAKLGDFPMIYFVNFAKIACFFT